MTEDERIRNDDEIIKYVSEYQSTKDLAEYWEVVNASLLDLQDAIKVFRENFEKIDLRTKTQTYEEDLIDFVEEQGNDLLDTVEKHIDVLQDAVSDAKFEIGVRVANGDVVNIGGEVIEGCRPDYY